MLNNWFINFGFYSSLTGEVSLILGLLFMFIVGLIKRWEGIAYNDFVDYIYLFTLVTIIATFWAVFRNNLLLYYGCNHIFIGNAFISSVKLFILILMLIFLWGSYDYCINNWFPIFEFFNLILLNILGVFLLLHSNTLFVLYLSIEMQSLALYVLIAAKPFSVYSTEASLKYFLYSVFLTLGLLFGISLIYNQIGTLNLQELRIIFTESFQDFFLIKLGIFLIIFGFLLKLAIFPFHGWIADLYLGANLLCVSFIATIPKIVFNIILIKILIIFSFYKFELSLLLGILGCSTIILGTFIGLYQAKLLRLLGFSAMVNMGHIVVGISLQSIEGIVASCYSIFIYNILILSTLIIIMAYRTIKYWELKFIVDLVELMKSNKFVSLIFTTLILSLAGLPPFAGFCGKFLIFLAIVKQGEYFYAFIIFITSILTTVYYLRLIRFLYFSSSDAIKNQTLAISKSIGFLIVLIFLFNVLLFFFQGPIILLITNLVIEYFFLNKM